MQFVTCCDTGRHWTDRHECCNIDVDVNINLIFFVIGGILDPYRIRYLFCIFEVSLALIDFILLKLGSKFLKYNQTIFQIPEKLRIQLIILVHASTSTSALKI